MCKISVVVPCYNHEQHLATAIESVIAQTISDWECIIINDGSQDGSEAVALKYVEKDSRIRYYHQENGGPSKARNKGIEVAKGEYILPLDSDDKISPDYMQLALERFEKYPETTLVYCKARFFGSVNKSMRLSPYVYDKLRYKNMIFASCFMRRADILGVGGYDETMRLGLEDWEMLLRLLTKESVVYCIPKVCFFYRQAENSTTSSALRNRDEIYHYILKKNIHLYYGIWGPIIQNHIWRSRLRKIGKYSIVAQIFRYLICKEERKW